MRWMKDAELRVVLAVVRLTLGWHRVTTRATIRTMMQLTGLSRGGVLAGARDAEADGLLVKTVDNDGTRYTINVFDSDGLPLWQAWHRNHKKRDPADLEDAA